MMYLENYNRLINFNNLTKDPQLKKGADTLEMVKEPQTPCCNLCQKMPCTCSRNGMVTISPHVIMPLDIRLPNYLNPIYPMDQNYMQNPVYPMDHSNLLPYHNLKMVIPSNVPLLSPPSSSSPPSPQSSPTTIRPRKSAKKFECNVCGRSFDYKHVLQNHQRIHTGEKPFGCNVCGNRFTRDHHLKTHMRLHTGEKPFLCNYCDMRFVQVANLRRHVRVHDPIKCEICDKRFPDINRLRSHVLEHTADSTNGLCDICHVHHHPENDCPLKMNELRISHRNDIDDDSDVVSSGDSHTSNVSDQISHYEETESIPQVLDLSTVVKNATQSEPEDLSMKKYY